MGFYGDNCTSACSCRSYTECDFIAGNCSCEEGYTGITCHSPCEDGYYGNNCNSLCTCEGNGTESCDNVNGTCLCLSMWSGEDCEIPRAPPCKYNYIINHSLKFLYTACTFYSIILSICQPVEDS